jgi:hypothetical protein
MAMLSQVLGIRLVSGNATNQGILDVAAGPSLEELIDNRIQAMHCVLTLGRNPTVRIMSYSDQQTL